jgi:hypothetical protein
MFMHAKSDLGSLSMIWAGVAICVVGLLAIAPFFRLLTAGSKRRNCLGAADVADRIEKQHFGDRRSLGLGRLYLNSNS